MLEVWVTGRSPNLCQIAYTWLVNAPGLTPVNAPGLNAPDANIPAQVVWITQSIDLVDAQGVLQTRQRFSDTPILVVSFYPPEEELILELFRSGVQGYLCMTERLAERQAATLIAAIQQVAHGHAVIDPTITRDVLDEIRNLLIQSGHKDESECK